MRINFDWPAIYSALVSDSPRLAKNGFAAARKIEGDIFKQGWPAGEVFGDQANLIHRYGFSRGTLREAVRLLEDRNVARMKRGPGGGLVVLPISGAALAQAVADQFVARGIEYAHVKQARAALNIVSAYLVACDEGPYAVRAFSKEFRSRLMLVPGAGLLGPNVLDHWPKRTRRANAFIDLFESCLDATELRLSAQRAAAAGQAGTFSAVSRSSPAATKARGLPGRGRSRAHELAWKLAAELQQHRLSGDVERIGTEDKLCERHRVSREVLRQAIRVLQSHGLIESQRGRTHGLHAGNSAGSSAMAERVVAYLSSIHISCGAFERIAQIFSRIVRVVVLAEATPQQRAGLQSATHSVRAFDKVSGSVTSLLIAEWALVSNPAIKFMERCVTAYYARVSADFWPFFDDAGMHFMRQLHGYGDAAGSGNLAQADIIVEDLCMRITAITQSSTAANSANHLRAAMASATSRSAL